MIASFVLMFQASQFSRDFLWISASFWRIFNHSTTRSSTPIFFARSNTPVERVGSQCKAISSNFKKLSSLIPYGWFTWNLKINPFEIRKIIWTIHLHVWVQNVNFSACRALVLVEFSRFMARQPTPLLNVPPPRNRAFMIRVYENPLGFP